jgi:protein gp37
MNKSKIEWTDYTWNPITGCKKVSDGCKNCYAERIAENQRGNKVYPNGFDVMFRPERMDDLSKVTQPFKVFVGSLTDLFQDDVTNEQIISIFEKMHENPQHTYQILTKRPLRMVTMINTGIITVTDNMWLGVTIENSKNVFRGLLLNQIDHPNKWLSMEPLVGEVSIQDLRLINVNWIVVGGESGPGFREMDPSWAKNIQEYCEKEEISFFFKQWSGIKPGSSGKVLEGKTYDQYPDQKED